MISGKAFLRPCAVSVVTLVEVTSPHARRICTNQEDMNEIIAAAVPENEREAADHEQKSAEYALKPGKCAGIARMNASILRGSNRLILGPHYTML